MFGLREKCKERKTKREGREKELFVWLERNGGKERKMEGMNFNGPILFLSNWRKLESRDFFFIFYILCGLPMSFLFFSRIFSLGY